MRCFFLVAMVIPQFKLVLSHLFYIIT